MTAAILPAPPAALAQPVVDAPVATAAPIPGDAADRPSVGDLGWSLVTVVLGPVAGRNPDVALAILRTADDLALSGHAWVQRLVRRPAPSPPDLCTALPQALLEQGRTE